DAFLRQKNHQRVQRVQAAAAARARREAILDANTARLKAKMAKPDLQYARKIVELNDEGSREQYAQGFSVGVAATKSIDGILVKSASGIYDTFFGRVNPLLDEEVERYRREFLKQDPSLAGLMIVAMRDLSTSAELARRADPEGLGRVANVLTFNQFLK